MRKILFLSALLAAGHAAAQTQPATPGAIQNLAACIDMESDAERLACYDAQARPLVEATESGDIVAVEREDVRQIERESFGLSLSGVASLASRLLPSGEDEGGRLETLQATIRGAHEFKPGLYRFELDNGQVWEQTTADQYFAPRDLDGAAAEIRGGALGSYFIHIGDNPRVRVQRTQ